MKSAKMFLRKISVYRFRTINLLSGFSFKFFGEEINPSRDNFFFFLLNKELENVKKRILTTSHFFFINKIKIPI